MINTTDTYNLIIHSLISVNFFPLFDLIVVEITLISEKRRARATIISALDYPPTKKYIIN